ncbi:MAG: hypothetical protein DMG53_26090 [Acidobacteria bacterium]|nr:MAG: hypothetical protein DMG53_26090 [Acidobacteriota bacterium]
MLNVILTADNGYWALFGSFLGTLSTPTPHRLPSTIVREDEHLLVAAARFYTWLVRIAANEALMRLRKRRPNQFSLDEPIEGDTDLFPRELEDWGPTPEQRYAQTEMQNIVGDVIDRLDPEYRIVFLLRDFEELSTQETAEMLGISVPAVKSRLLRARLKLREKLNRHFRQGAPN